MVSVSGSTARGEVPYHCNIFCVTLNEFISAHDHLDVLYHSATSAGADLESSGLRCARAASKVRSLEKLCRGLPEIDRSLQEWECTELKLFNPGAKLGGEHEDCMTLQHFIGGVRNHHQHFLEGLLVPDREVLKEVDEILEGCDEVPDKSFHKSLCNDLVQIDQRLRQDLLATEKRENDARNRPRKDYKSVMAEAKRRKRREDLKGRLDICKRMIDNWHEPPYSHCGKSGCGVLDVRSSTNTESRETSVTTTGREKSAIIDLVGATFVEEDDSFLGADTDTEKSLVTAQQTNHQKFSGPIRSSGASQRDSCTVTTPDSGKGSEQPVPSDGEQLGATSKTDGSRKRGSSADEGTSAGKAKRNRNAATKEKEPSDRDRFVYDNHHKVCPASKLKEKSSQLLNFSAKWLKAYSPGILSDFTATNYDSERITLQFFEYFCAVKHRAIFISPVNDLIHARWCQGCNNKAALRKYINDVHHNYLLCWLVLKRKHGRLGDLARTQCLETLVDAFAIFGEEHHLRKFIALFLKYYEREGRDVDYGPQVDERFENRLPVIKKYYKTLQAQVLSMIRDEVIDRCRKAAEPEMDVYKLSCEVLLAYRRGFPVKKWPGRIRGNALSTYRDIREVELFPAEESRKKADDRPGVDAYLACVLCDEWKFNRREVRH